MNTSFFGAKKKLKNLNKTIQKFQIETLPVMSEKVPINLLIIKIHFFQKQETWKEKHSQHPFNKKT